MSSVSRREATRWGREGARGAVGALWWLLVMSAVASGACGSRDKKPALPSTYGEEQAGYSYVALEPSTVQIKCVDAAGAAETACSSTVKDRVLKALPDNSVRISTRLLSGSASASVGAIGSSVGVAGKSYEVIIDFANTQTLNVRFEGRWQVDVADTVKIQNRCYPFQRKIMGFSPFNKHELWNLEAKILAIESEGYQVPENAAVELDRGRDPMALLRCAAGVSPPFPDSDYQAVPNRSDLFTISQNKIDVAPEPFNVPVYIGIGFRLKAQVTVLSGKVDLSSLAAITAAVKAEQAKGTMSVQTLGVSGKAARTNLQFLDRIDETTIQSAIQVLASIKASIDTDGDTTINPRVIGMHNTVAAGPQGINLIHSQLVAAKLSLVVPP